MILRKTSIVLLVCLHALCAYNQDISQLPEESTGDPTEFTTATFKSTRIINGHSVEKTPEGHLAFRISHRFGEINTGAYNLWGLDQANTSFGFEYGIADWVMVGIGRGTYEKTYDAFLKFSILRQSKGKRTMPVSVSYFASSAINTIKWTGTEPLNAWHRVSYVHQLLIARKFSEAFSLEINPTFVHRNMVETGNDPNDVWALGTGFRVKLSRRLSMNAEYYLTFPTGLEYLGQTTYNPLSIGLDIETRGHVFSIMLTNSLAMIEKGFIAETTGSWKDGGIHLGFGISREFILK